MEYSSKIGKELKTGWEFSEGQRCMVTAMCGVQLKDRKRAKNRMECSEGQICMVTAMCGVQLKDRKRAKNRMGI